MDTVQIEKLLTDISQRIEGLPVAMTEEQIKSIANTALQQALADPNSEVYRKMRFAQPDHKLLGSKYARWNLSLADIEFLYDLQTSLAGQPRVNKDNGAVYLGPGEELTNAFKAISEAMYVPTETIRAMDRKALDGVFPRITKQNEKQYEAALKAMDSAETGYGLQLIGAEYVRTLWDVGRSQSRVMNLIDTFEMTDPLVYLPVEVDIPEMLFVSEKTSSTISYYDTVKTGSNRVSVAALKFIIHQMWSGEMEEDSIIPFLPFLRRQAELSLAYYADSLVLNGDTTNAGTGNINLDDADPADTKHYLAFDGIRHVGLVDNTNNQKDLSNVAVTPDDLVDARKRLNDLTYMVDWGRPNNPADVVHIVDSGSAYVLEKDEYVRTVDKYGANATILTGEVGQLGRHPLIISDALKLTEADGKLSTTGTNNTRGQIVTFNTRGYKWGWRRRVKLETERIIGTDQTRLVYSLRAGLGRFTPTGAASGIESADVIFNIAVA